MANKVDAARSAIERLLKKDPDATMDDCRKAAVRHDPAAKKAAPRSFNARYVLPVKRLLNPAKPKRSVRKARRKASGTKATSRTGQARAASNRSLSAKQREAVRMLVLERDQKIVRTLSGRDARAGYELAATLDAYINELVAASRS